MYLGHNNHLVSVAALLHPLPDEFLRRFVLVVVRGIDEVAARLVERVEELEAALLAHCAHAEFLPLVTDAHRAECERRDVHARKWAELAVVAELGWGSGCGRPTGHRVLFSVFVFEVVVGG